MMIGIVGTGWVGSSVAISILHSGVATELVLSDARADLAEGEAMDLAHGAAFYPACRVRSAQVREMCDADAVVIAAGRGGSADESRLSLLRDNAAIVSSIASQLKACRGLVVVVTNPVDIMTAVAARASGLPCERVIGTGTMLDTARLRQAVGSELELDARSVHAQVIGEHGDSQVVLWSGARIGGVPLKRWPGWTSEREMRIAEQVRGAAYAIIARKGATNHAIGLATAALLRSALRGERRVLTVSRMQEGALGVRDVALSLPAVVGSRGATPVLEPEIAPDERAALARSAEILRDAATSLS